MIFLFRIIYRTWKGIFYKSSKFITKIYSILLFKAENVVCGKNISIYGIPIISTSKNRGKIVIGDDFTMNNGMHYNQIGRQQPCFIIVGNNALLSIGNNVGISSSAIVCFKEIIIEDNVKIGGNTAIYDSDFHDLNYNNRISLPERTANIRKEKVCIKKNVFIGAHSTILKGVTIGENSIIGACSVVTKNIPDNEIWAGNPAVFIRRIS